MVRLVTKQEMKQVKSHPLLLASASRFTNNVSARVSLRGTISYHLMTRASQVRLSASVYEEKRRVAHERGVEKGRRQVSRTWKLTMRELFQVGSPWSDPVAAGRSRSTSHDLSSASSPTSSPRSAKPSNHPSHTSSSAASGAQDDPDKAPRVFWAVDPHENPHRMRRQLRPYVEGTDHREASQVACLALMCLVFTHTFVVYSLTFVTFVTHIRPH